MSSILIVDDALFMRNMIRSALEPLAFDTIVEAQNGREALEKFEGLQPDVVTLDVVMPEMDGLATLEAIRGASPETQVIMITALDQRETMLKAMRLGVSDFVVKPFDDGRVISAVEKALTRTNASAAAPAAGNADH